MPRSRAGRPGRLAVRCFAGMLAAVLQVPGPLPAAGAGEPFRPSRFRVDSIPGGAEVYTIGGRVGTTPLTLSERDIYPNWYPDGQAHLYGVVVLRKAGCAEYTRRVGRNDIGTGIEARLACGQDVPAREATPAQAPVIAAPAAATAAGVTTPQRRLHQLQVLQELLEDGLVTEQEERTIRKRILDAR
jgi:hypothetical protein